MITTTTGLVLLGVGLTLLVPGFGYVIYKTKWFKGYPDRVARLSYMAMLLTAISWDLTVGLLIRSGFEVVHPWCCLSIIPLFGALIVRYLGFKETKKSESEAFM